jgi:thiol-disulfide isomerase/thioredoxin
MVRTAGIIGVALGALTIAASPAWSQNFDAGIAVGSAPAAITLPDLDGKQVDLSQFIGKKPVLLEFWATWCPLCKALMPRIDAAHTKYKDRMEFIAIGVGVNQTPASIKRHLVQHPIPLAVLYDGNGAAVRAFDAPATSYVVVLDAQGKVVYTGQGDEQDIDAAVAKAFPAPPAKSR